MDSRKKEIKMALKQMAEIEPEWNEEALTRFAKNQFIQIQNDWSYQNLNALGAKLSPELYRNWKAQLEVQKANNERETFDGLSVNQIFVVDVKNYLQDEMDNFTVCIDASGTDKTIRDNKVVAIKNVPFREFWTFGRFGESWQLLEVTQATGWQKFVDSQIVFEKIISKRKS